MDYQTPQTHHRRMSVSHTTKEIWELVPDVFDGGEGLELENGKFLLETYEYKRFNQDNSTMTCSINVEECITDTDLQTLHDNDKEISDSTFNEFMRLFCWHNKQGFGNMPPEYHKPPNENTYWVSSVVHCSESSSGGSEFEVKRDLNGIVPSTTDAFWETAPDDQTKVMLTLARKQVQTVLIPIKHDDTGKYILAVLFLDKNKIVVYDIDNTDELPNSVKLVIDAELKEFWKTIQKSRAKNVFTFSNNVDYKSYVNKDVNTSEQVIYTMLRIIKQKINEEDDFVKDENSNKMKEWIAFVLFIFSKKEIKLKTSASELCKSATKDDKNHSMRILSEHIQALSPRPCSK